MHTREAGENTTDVIVRNQVVLPAQGWKACQLFLERDLLPGFFSSLYGTATL